MRTLILLICSLLFTAKIMAEPELKGSPSELASYLADLPKLVNVTGESELKVAADRALISLKVVTENKSLQEALRLNQEIRAKILSSLKERGIPEDRGRPSKFSSTPKYGVFGEKAKSYRVENVVRISAQDEKEFQAVAKLVDSIAEIRYDSIEFEHSNKEELKAKVLGQAIDKALEKKKLYEEKLGIKLLPRTFAEGGASLTSPSRRPERYDYAVREASSKGSRVTPLAAAPTMETEEMVTSFGELIFTAQVTLEYSETTK